MREQRAVKRGRGELLWGRERLAYRIRHIGIRIAIRAEVIRLAGIEGGGIETFRQETFLEPQGSVARILLDESAAAAACAETGVGAGEGVSHSVGSS